jgi:TonB family protein
MEALGFYLLKSAIWLTGFGLVYAIFLQNERFFQLNRIYLVAGMIASIILPLITVRYAVAVPEIQTQVTAGALSGGVLRAATRPDLPSLLLYFAWLAGVLLIAARYLIQLVPVLKAAKRAQPVSGYPVKLIRSSDFTTPFSLFSFVVVNPSVSETETREIMNHEVVHIRQKHWLDLLLTGSVCAVQWFNPAVWIYSRFIRQNHEYLADAEALQRTSDPVLYRAALLNQIAGSPVIDLGNSFSFSLNKKRFTMMKNKISSPYRKLRLLLILPVAALVLYAFAEPQYRVTSEGADLPLASAVQADITKSIKGVVLSEDGTPLVGAVIVIQGTTVGTTSDDKGRFALENVADDGVLIVSFVGYETAAVKASAGPELTIGMKKKPVVMKTLVVTAQTTDASAATSPPPPPPTPPPPPPPPSSSDKAAPKGEVYTVVEEMPEFPGGQEAMFVFVRNNFKYPDEAKAQNITGLVRVSFVVKASGKVSDVKVEKSAHKLLDAEAVRVVKSMPDWKPGKQHGKSVDVGYIIPVEFNLKAQLKVTK